jgi:hypothetical protein
VGKRPLGRSRSKKVLAGHSDPLELESNRLSSSRMHVWDIKRVAEPAVVNVPAVIIQLLPISTAHPGRS